MNGEVVIVDGGSCNLTKEKCGHVHLLRHSVLHQLLSSCFTCFSNLSFARLMNTLIISVIFLLISVLMTFRRRGRRACADRGRTCAGARPSAKSGRGLVFGLFEEFGRISKKFWFSTGTGNHSIRSSVFSASSTANFCIIVPTIGISASIFQWATPFGVGVDAGDTRHQIDKIPDIREKFANPFDARI